MLKTILNLAKMKYKESSIYKANYALFIINRLVEVVVYICVWQAIYQQTGKLEGYTIQQMITYYILVTSIRLIAFCGINNMIGHSIRNGKINKELLSPISYLKYYWGIYLGELLFCVIISVLIFLICMFFWNICMPVNLESFLLFLLIIALGIPITFFIQMIVGITSFYTSSIWGMEVLRRGIISIFSGYIAPLALFPQWFQKIADILPFKELIYTPINIYLGQTPPNEIIYIILKQIIWIIILYAITKVFFNHAVKKITINGG